ncbi:MAG: hypothetical protein WDW36_010240 [Sanguina aurantia]
MDSAQVCRSTTSQQHPSSAAVTDVSSVVALSSDSPQKHVKLFYRTAWDQAWVHGSVCGNTWQDHPLLPVTSAPGRWLTATFPTGSPGASSEEGAADGGSSSPALLEFVVTDRSDAWDKPETGSNYRITSPGTYTLSGGALSPVSGRPVMLVSDLDGTMVGDDEASGAFKAWWQEAGVTRGGVLVYNTGRALDSFQALLSDKSHCLAPPDALISAVGTKVYEFESGRWREDQEWTALLGEGWDLAVAREAAYRTLAQVGKDVMHFRPPDEQNDHKVTCGLAVAVLPQALASLSALLEGGGVQANVIVSGAGDWRYVDIVPIRAGKLEALHHVRRRHGFEVSSTVACGDSGNDILMLSGLNPAIVVGNAQPDLRAWLETRQRVEAAPAPGAPPRLLLATQHEAYGILEGLEALGFL